MPRSIVELKQSDPRNLRFEPLNILWGGPLLVEKKRQRPQPLQQKLQQQQLQLQQQQQQQQQQNGPPPRQEQPLGEGGSPSAYAVVAVKRSSDTLETHIRMPRGSGEHVIVVDGAEVNVDGQSQAAAQQPQQQEGGDEEKKTKDKNEEKKEDEKEARRERRRQRRKTRRQKKARQTDEAGSSGDSSADSSDGSSLASDVSRLARRLYRSTVCDHHDHGDMHASSDSDRDRGRDRDRDRRRRHSRRRSRSRQRGRSVGRQERHSSTLRCSSCGRQAHVFSDFADDGHGNRETLLRAVRKSGASHQHRHKHSKDTTGDHRDGQSPQQTDEPSQNGQSAHPGQHAPTSPDQSRPRVHFANQAPEPNGPRDRPYPAPYGAQPPVPGYPPPYGFLSFTYPYPTPHPQAPYSMPVPVPVPQEAFAHPHNQGRHYDQPPPPPLPPPSPAAYSSLPWPADRKYRDAGSMERHGYRHSYSRSAPRSRARGGNDWTSPPHQSSRHNSRGGVADRGHGQNKTDSWGAQEPEGGIKWEDNSSNNVVGGGDAWGDSGEGISGTTPNNGDDNWASTGNGNGWGGSNPGSNQGSNKGSDRGNPTDMWNNDNANDGSWAMHDNNNNINEAVPGNTWGSDNNQGGNDGGLWGDWDTGNNNDNKGGDSWAQNMDNDNGNSGSGSEKHDAWGSWGETNGNQAGSDGNQAGSDGNEAPANASAAANDDWCGWNWGGNGSDKADSHSGGSDKGRSSGYQDLWASWDEADARQKNNNNSRGQGKNAANQNGNDGWGHHWSSDGDPRRRASPPGAWSDDDATLLRRLASRLKADPSADRLGALQEAFYKETGRFLSLGELRARTKGSRR